jgi:hypothetical protein
MFVLSISPAEKQRDICKIFHVMLLWLGDHLADLDVCGVVVLTDLEQMLLEGLDFVYLVRGRNKRQNLVNEVMNLRVS